MVHYRLAKAERLFLVLLRLELSPASWMAPALNGLALSAPADLPGRNCLIYLWLLSPLPYLRSHTHSVSFVSCAKSHARPIRRWYRHSGDSRCHCRVRWIDPHRRIRPDCIRHPRGRRACTFIPESLLTGQRRRPVKPVRLQFRKSRRPRLLVMVDPHATILGMVFHSSPGKLDLQCRPRPPSSGSPLASASAGCSRRCS